MCAWSPLNESPQTLKWMQQVLRKAPPFSQSLLKSKGDAGLTLACLVPKLDTLVSSANAKLASGSSLVFSILTSNFHMIACVKN